MGERGRREVWIERRGGGEKGVGRGEKGRERRGKGRVKKGEENGERKVKKERHLVEANRLSKAPLGKNNCQTLTYIHVCISFGSAVRTQNAEILHGSR